MGCKHTLIYECCKAGSHYGEYTTVQREHATQTGENIEFHIRGFMCGVLVCVHVFKIKVFFNPVVDSDGGDLLISALNPNETVFLQQLVICSNSDLVPFPSQTHTCTLGSSPTLTYRHSSICKLWIYKASSLHMHLCTTFLPDCRGVTMIYSAIIYLFIGAATLLFLGRKGYDTV